jgi:hypothetical protein
MGVSSKEEDRQRITKQASRCKLGLYFFPIFGEERRGGERKNGG